MKSCKYDDELFYSGNLNYLLDFRVLLSGFFFGCGGMVGFLFIVFNRFVSMWLLGNLLIILLGMIVIFWYMGYGNWLVDLYFWLMMKFFK